jgi:putative ABC transport system permease protein
MLGVVIGVGALVGLVSIVQAATFGISSSLNSLGGSNLTISAAAGGTLTDEDAEAIAQLDGVASVTTSVSGQLNALHGKKTALLGVEGVSASYALSTTIDLEAGTFLPEAPSARSARLAVLSTTAATNLGMTAADVGSTFVLDGQTFTAIGILKEASLFGGYGAGTVYIPLEVARTIYAPVPGVDGITVSAATTEAVDGLVSSVTQLLKTRHHIAAGQDADFTVTNQADLLAEFNSIRDIMQLVLGGIASISLLVGGIGIMNIMLVSVRERTREIGVRRAIGAKRRNILAQFLVEAVVLSVIGGILGLLLGVAIAAIAAVVGGLAFAIAPWVVALALGFSALVGIVFGVGPARTAARMLPVEALRYE